MNGSQKRFCPPHYMPHTFRFIGKKVNDGKCHIPAAKWRNAHCKFLKCKNYNNMIKSEKKFKNENNSH